VQRVASIEGLRNDHRIRAADYHVDDDLGLISQAGLIVLDW
jgi:hypothetical protein